VVHAPKHIPGEHGELALLAERRVLVIAHRGFCQQAPENTLPAFELALDFGADLVELDFRVAKDGVPLVIHDILLDRTTNARWRWKGRRIPVSHKTAAEIRSLDAGSWFGRRFTGTKVPLLSEALDTISSRGIALIEHKSGSADDCAKLVREKHLINRVVVQSFNWEFLRRFHECEPRQTLGALGPPFRLANGAKPLHISRRLSRAWLLQAQKAGVKVVVWNWRVSKREIQFAHELGLKVWSYTINRLRPARRLIDAGIDGLITDKPELIREVVRSYA
jgi:glycerophosphoryl diester phosphodiesterase